jgi:serine/threonine protein kinase
MMSENEVPEDEIGYGQKADVWSLGIMAAELLDKGRMPWPNFVSPGHAFMHISSPKGIPVPPEGISPAAAAFVLRCCQRDPKLRPTCGELLLDPWLTACADGPNHDSVDAANRDEYGMSSSERF